jgi:DNA-directed RNA polymerase specialized sigma24 family protein
VLVLRYWEDRSVADTAVDLGLTETTARTRARRALERLRPLVGAEITERTLT